MNKKYTKLYVVCAQQDYEGIESLESAFYDEKDAIEEMDKLNYGRQCNHYDCLPVDLIEHKETIQIKCPDCTNGMVTNSVNGEPDDCYTCGGNYLQEMYLEDAPITAEALDQAGWFKEMRGHNGNSTVWMSRPEDGSNDKVVEVWEWPTPSGYLIGCFDCGEEGTIFEHVKAMGQLNDLVLLYTGQPVQKGIDNAVE